MQEMGSLPGTTKSLRFVVNNAVWLKQLVSNGKQLVRRWESQAGAKRESAALTPRWENLSPLHCKSEGKHGMRKGCVKIYYC